MTKSCSMKRKTVFGCLAVALVMMAAIVSFLGYWAYKYYGSTLPELPDHGYYESLEHRSEAALKVIKRHNLNEDYCLFIDYSIPSGTPRMFVWSFKENRVISSTYVMHGPGMGSTAEKPVFSNRPCSNCSSLGRFIVTKHRGTRLKRSFRLSGLDIDNRTAYARGLLIHSSKWVDAYCWKDYIPLHEKSCKGCVTVSTRGLDYLENLINSQQKRLLLWSFCSETDK